MTYEGINSSTSWQFEGGAAGSSCPPPSGFIPGTFVTTPVVVNGPLKVGMLVTVTGILYDWKNNVLPSGSCPDHIGSVTQVQYGTAAPAPSSSPTATSSPSPQSPTASPTSSTAYSTNVALISNSSEWPTNYRAFCANTVPTPSAPCPYNVVLPASPANVMTQNGGSSTILAAMQSHSALGVGIMNNTVGANSAAFPTYLAASTDPAVSITCTQYCWNGSSMVSSYSATIPNLPTYARALPALCAGDCQMEIVEPDGTAYSIYGMSGQYSGGSSITAVGFAETNVETGNGVDPCGTSLGSPGNGGGCTANGGTIMAQDTGIRVDEINNGVIPHALVVETNYCGSGQVYPGSSGYDCSANYGYTGAPLGARLILNLTDAQINGTTSNTLGYTESNTSAWERVLLHEFRDYGLILGPTCAGGCGSAGLLLFTQAEQISASGGTPPTASFNWSSPAGGGGGVGTFPSPWTPGGLSLTNASSWIVVSPCYSLETCSDSVN